MSQDNVIYYCKPEVIEDPLTESLRTGARGLIQQAVEAGLSDLVVVLRGRTGGVGVRCTQRLSAGARGADRDRVGAGEGPEGPRSRTEEAVVFRSSLMSPHVRRTKTVDATLPWLYLKPTVPSIPRRGLSRKRS